MRIDIREDQTSAIDEIQYTDFSYILIHEQEVEVITNFGSDTARHNLSLDLEDLDNLILALEKARTIIKES